MSSPNASFEPEASDRDGARLKWSAFVRVSARDPARDAAAISAPPHAEAPVSGGEAPAAVRPGAAAAGPPTAPSPAADVPPEPPVPAETGCAAGAPDRTDVPARRDIGAPLGEIRPERRGRQDAERPFREFSAGERSFETLHAAPVSRSRSWGRRVRRAGLHAAVLASAVAFGWICGELGLPRAADGAMRGSLASPGAAPQAQAPVADSPALRADMQGLKDEIARAQQALVAKLDQLTGRIEHVERMAQAPAAKLDQIAARLAQIEPHAGSVAAAAPQTAPAPNASAGAAKPGSGDAKAKMLSGWSIREVFDGIAVVDGPYGTVEVVTGDNIPGVGRVDAIRRRGNGWILVTSRGTIASDDR